MAQDYVRELQLQGATGRSADRPSVERTPQQLAAREAAARQADAENGRYGRFVDQQGNWAIAWQAPGPRTPVVAPAFLEPAARVKRLQTGELVVQAEGEEPLLIHPGDWVVAYESDRDHPLVAEDAAFRGVMTIERDWQASQAERKAIEEMPEDGAQLTRGSVEGDHPEHRREAMGAIGTGGPAQTFHTTLSVDNFVQQVLGDNARLRQENDQLNGTIAALQDRVQTIRQDRDAWRGHVDELKGRLDARLDEIEELRARFKDVPRQANGAAEVVELDRMGQAVDADAVDADATPNAAPATPEEPPVQDVQRVLDAQRGHARVNQPPRNKVMTPKRN